jgi:hypothetical protein
MLCELKAEIPLGRFEKRKSSVVSRHRSIDILKEESGIKRSLLEVLHL